MSILKDKTTGEDRKIHLCYTCDMDQYPTGKPIDPNDTLAEKLPSGEWICGSCQIEELNKRKIRVLGKDHPYSRFKIEQEEINTKSYNNYARE